MKQIAKTEAIKGRLRAAYGPDANLDSLAVYSVVALTTLPIRQSSGLFQGARNSSLTLNQIASMVQAESRPLLVEHDGAMVPIGRFFSAQSTGDKINGMIAVDGVNHPDLVSKLDSGTIDQVSVRFAAAAINCSLCGFDFVAPGNEMSVYTLTDDKGHTIGQDGVHAVINGVKQFFELSLVGMGGAPGARVLGPSDTQHNEQYQLAASANSGLVCVALSSPHEDPTEMTPEQMATFQAAVEGKATATAQLTTVTAERDSLQTQLSTATTRVTELEASAGQADTHRQNHDKAVAALTAEATTILTALKKPVDNLPKDVDALLTLITENRAAFAAGIPVGGAASGAASDTKNPTPARSTAAFRAPKK